MKLVKIGKTIIGCYLVMDVLAWSYIGVGRYFLDCNHIPDITKIGDLIGSHFDEATEGWKLVLNPLRRA